MKCDHIGLLWRADKLLDEKSWSLPAPMYHVPDIPTPTGTKHRGNHVVGAQTYHVCSA